MEEALLLFDQAAIVVLDAVVQLDALITAVCISNFKDRKSTRLNSSHPV